jgi:ABC-type thiamine transport system ATPase subunit
MHAGQLAIASRYRRPGSGKSTLLLIAPTSGHAKCRGETILGPPNGVAMVFQSFALFPWLTVLQNVELGLEALGIDSTERRTRALAAIDHRPRRLRIRLPEGIIGWHASARRVCPRAGRTSGPAPDG